MEVASSTSNDEVVKGFTGGMQLYQRRSRLHTTLLHLAVRIKYLFSSWYVLLYLVEGYHIFV